MTYPNASNFSLQTNNLFSSTAISQDGRFVIFNTMDNLDAADSNKQADLYLRDVGNGSSQRISVGTNGEQANNFSYGPDISANNRYVVFSSAATNLVAGDNNGAVDIFRKDLQTGELRLVSQLANGTLGNGDSSRAVISADGRYVSFESKAHNLGNLRSDADSTVYRKDMLTGEILVVASSSAGAQASGANMRPAMSADGNLITFYSHRSDIAGGSYEPFVKNMATGALTSLSGPPNHASSNAIATAISADGRYAAFTATEGFDPSDRNGELDVYVRDLQTNALTYASGPINSQHVASGSVTGFSLSADGHTLLFAYRGLDLVGNQQSFDAQLYARDLQTGALSNLSCQADGKSANGESYFPKLSGDGKSAFFATYATNLSADAGHQTNGYWVRMPQLDLAPQNDNFASVNSRTEGGGGDDTYHLYSKTDNVVEQADAGTDLIISIYDNLVLPANVEQLILEGYANHGSGNELDNYFRGTNAEYQYFFNGLAGNDTFYIIGKSGSYDGGTGFDTVQFDSDASDLTFTQGFGNSITMDYHFYESYGKFNLKDIERVQTYTYTIGLDIAGAAGKAYRIYQAAFNRTPDKDGLGFWIHQLDAGASLHDVTQGFVGSQEFQTNYANADNAAIVAKLYANVLHRAPDASGAQYWTDILNNHYDDVAGVLANFSESPENQAALIGTIQNGIVFTPFL